MKQLNESVMPSPFTHKQFEAASILDRNVFVSAGAGTGKTRVLVERFLKIIREKLAAPTEILAITFTDKAANEMKSRIVRELKNSGLSEARREIENAYIGTIHAFCSRLLKEHPIEAGIDPDFRVCEEEEAEFLKEAALDQVIEAHFEDPEIYEFLSTYDEEKIRERIKKIHERFAADGAQPDDLISKNSDTNAATLTAQLVQSLKQLLSFEAKQQAAGECLSFLEISRNYNWTDIETLKSFAGRFDLRARDGKEETKKAKLLFKKLTAFYVEELGAPFKRSFHKLIMAFDAAYKAVKKEHALFDFSDLQTLTLNLLGSESLAARAVRERYRAHFKFILIDEFQDVDSVQSLLIDLLRSEKNLFLVGDFKQSIYGFRGANPSLFQSKAKEFGESGLGTSIFLSDNFRSRKELLDFINPFFSELWKSGSNTYEPLKAAASFEPLRDVPVDLIEINKEKDETLDESRSEEARMIALRIQELVETQGYSYRDFALLFRAGSSIPFYEQELRSLKIPYYMIGGRGFYTQSEVRDVMNCLIALENPMRDIPLAAILRSPLFHLADDALFWLAHDAKKTDKRAPLYPSVVNCEAISELCDTDRQKLKRFNTVFAALLNEKNRISVSELIELILTNTQYDLYVLGESQGKRRFANLRKLIDLAREIERREALHLGDFVRYVKNLVFREVRESEAQVEAEEGEVVKLMTIHKAKGLQFKCVVIPDLARGRKQSENLFLAHPEFGLGIKIHNPFSGEFEETLSYQKIREQMEVLEAEESKRLLYVAMTRAEEHLILAGTVTSSKEIKEDSFNWFDWVRNVISARALLVNRLSCGAQAAGKRRHKMPLIDQKKARERIENLQPILSKPSPRIEEILNRLQVHEGAFFERVDLPVSAFLTFAQDENHEEFRRIYELGAASVPLDFKSEEPVQTEIEETISPADFGTLTHHVFEHIVSWRGKEPPIDEWIAFYGRDFDAAAKDQVRKLSDLFLTSKLLAFVRRSKQVFPELPFVLRLKHGVIQGTLDLLCESSNGEYVIIDYKTSELKSSQIAEYGESYRTQLELYALACYKLTGKAPAKASVYFVKIDDAHEISFSGIDFLKLEEKFEALQKKIIEFRKQLLTTTRNGFISYVSQV